MRISKGTVKKVFNVAYRQWGTYLVVIAMLFNMVVPMNVCRCEDCPVSSRPPADTNDQKSSCCCCEDHNSVPATVPSDKKPSGKKCCRGSTDHHCQCHNVQKENAIVSTMVIAGEKTDADLLGYALSLGYARLIQEQSVIDHRQVLLPSHVPRHVLFCVFLN